MKTRKDLDQELQKAIQQLQRAKACVNDPYADLRSTAEMVFQTSTSLAWTGQDIEQLGRAEMDRALIQAAEETEHMDQSAGQKSSWPRTFKSIM